MSSQPPSETSPAEFRAALSQWLKREVTALERIGGGRNSQVYQLTLAGRGAAESPSPAPLSQGARGTSTDRLALKVYFRHPADQRDRLATEFNSFAYLWADGVREIPQPLAFDAAHGWAVYEFIDGERILPGQASENEVVAAAEFLGRLRELSRKPESRKLGLASEAFFAPSLIAANVRQRLARLEAALGVEVAPASSPAAQPGGAPIEAALFFLQDAFKPFLETIVPWSAARLSAAGQSFTDELDWPFRTLSPSDFGFHNALRLPPEAPDTAPAGGGAGTPKPARAEPGAPIIFLDFEYFGWDDPVKMIADFLLHPAMNLSVPLKQVFASVTLRRFADWPGLLPRLESVYPLFGLKWCMILLNEFLPEALQRRQFAAISPAEHSALQTQQLAKARAMLDRIRGEYQNFPYRD